MDTQMEIRIRSLAHPLWESAARPYGMALDFWLMAEQMILEMLTGSARMVRTAAGEAAAAEDTSVMAPLNRVQELAHCMWENAGKQYELALDCWLSAEQHAIALNRAATAARDGAKELAALPAPAYLDHIRRNAYFLWEEAGRQYGNALDYWLQAERQVLKAVSEASTGGGPVPGPPPELNPAETAALP